MRHFKTYTGELINPVNVTHVTVKREAGAFVLRYSFTSGSSREYTFDRHQDAVEELTKYEEHCQTL